MESSVNSLVRDQFDILHETSALREQLLERLSDADLSYRLPGRNASLGELCRENGQVQQSYIDSFKTFKMNFAYPPVDPALEKSVERLKAWFKQLDADLDAALRNLTEHDVQSKVIERGFNAPVHMQFHIYREALLIFYGKADVYLRALDKQPSQQWREWIG